MKTRSVVRWTLLATWLVFLLAAACAAPAPTPAQFAPAAPAAPKLPTAPAAAEQASGVVTFITHADHPFEVKALTQAVDEFARMHPDIKVVCTIVVPSGAWAPGGSSPCAFVVAN